MSSTYVALAEVLEARGGPLVEDEVWSLLLGTAESLVDVSYKGHNSMSTIISPSSLLLSATGTLAFKNCAVSDEVTTFTAPEMLQGRASSTKPAMEKMLVYSLGMTLYWSVDYHLPQNQPVPLSDHLNSLLLSMCEDATHRRVNLNAILEVCESQHKTLLLPPPNRVIKQLVEDVFHDSMDHGTQPDSIVHLSGRSQMIRERLHGKRGLYPEYGESSPGADSRRYSEDSVRSDRGSLHHRPWRQRDRPRSSPTQSYLNTDRLPRGPPRSLHRDSSSSSSIFRSPLHSIDLPPRPSTAASAARTHSPSISFSESSLSLTRREAKALGPEFIRMADEQPIIVELPGSIVSKKGRSCVSQREVNVIMPNGQTVSVRCDLRSRGRDVFDMVVAHANLVEHFYFGLAFLDDDEYFFLDHETKISKVAPDGWKKVQAASFLVYLRVKFFVDDISFVLHKMTRRQFYLQLRKDILEDRLYCNEETGMFLAALALQAEFGDYMPELYGKNYYQPEHYLSKRLREKKAIPSLREELLNLHVNHTNMLPEEAQTEYMKIAQQLPEYGVVFHRVGREKKPVVGELVLGVSAQGIMVYEVKNHLRVLTRRFLWRETDSISTGRRKLTIECGPSGKKHNFVTESSKIAQYLLNFCSAQHKFHSEMTSRQLNHSMAQDENGDKHLSVSRCHNARVNRISCSETGLNMLGLSPGPSDMFSKSCDDLSAKMEARLQQQRKLRERNMHMTPEPRPLRNIDLPGARDFRELDPPERELRERPRELRDLKDAPCWSPPGSNTPLRKRDSLRDSPTSSQTSSIRVDTPTKGPAEREIVCVTLKKDPKLGFGFIMVGEDNTGKLDLGIFIASVVPDGPADRDGRIRPGGRLISLNKVSLEGVTFADAAAILASSPEEVELIVSQPKHSLRDSKSSLAPSTLGLMLERGFGSQSTLSGTEFRPAVEELEEALALSNMATPKQGKRLHVPVVRILDPQEVLSRSSSVSSLNRGEQLSVELRKSNGSLGISVAGGVNTSVHYGGIYIKSLVTGGAAEQDGRIQIGDRLLEVDGFNLRGVTHKQAVECLKRTGEVVSLLLERENPMVFEPGSDSPRPRSARSLSQCSFRPDITMDTPLTGRAKDLSFVNDDNTLEVVLRKSPSGLGFGFFIQDLGWDPGRNQGTVVRIKFLFPGQPAQECGLIREGDVILAVNGESVTDLSYQRVLQLLRGAPSEVRLLICRPSPGELKELDSCNTLSPSCSPTKEVRSRSLDIRLTEDYSLLLKKREQEQQRGQTPEQAQDQASGHGSTSETPPPRAPTPPDTQQDEDSVESLTLPPPPPYTSPPPPHTPPRHSPPHHSPPHHSPPPSPDHSSLSPLSPPSSPSPPSPGLSGERLLEEEAKEESRGEEGEEEEEEEEGEVVRSARRKEVVASVLRLRRGSYIKASDNPMYSRQLRERYRQRFLACSTEPSTPASERRSSTGVREEADGSHTYCLMGNGLTILADEEYLTISSTLTTPNSANNIPNLPLDPPSGQTPGISSHTPDAGSSHTLPIASSQTPAQTSDVSTPSSAPPNLCSPNYVVPPNTPCQPGHLPDSTHSAAPIPHPSNQSSLTTTPDTSDPPPYSSPSPRDKQQHVRRQSVPPSKHSTKHSRPVGAAPPGPHPPLDSTPTTSGPQTPDPGAPGPPMEPLPASQPSPPQRHARFDVEGKTEDEDDEDPRKGELKEFELCVVLTKSRSGSFGFTIMRSHIDGCYYIQEILDNPAKSDGRLRPGDRLVTVNGHDVTNVSEEVAMAILRSSPRRMSMMLGRAVSNLVAPPPADSLNDVILYKTDCGQLGIKLTGGIGSKWQGIYCLEVVPGSPAFEEGSVRPNDKILYICGRCTLGMTLEDAVKECERAPRKVKLKILRDDQPHTPKVGKWNGLFDWKKDKIPKFPHFEELNSPEEIGPKPRVFRPRFSAPTELDSQVMKVDFTKPERGGLGFALVGGANGNVLRVKDICAGGVAEQDGRMRVGDILLEVNDVIVSGLSHTKVVDILRKAEGNVQLTICRDVLPLSNTGGSTGGSNTRSGNTFVRRSTKTDGHSNQLTVACSAPAGLNSGPVVPSQPPRPPGGANEPDPLHDEEEGASSPPGPHTTHRLEFRGDNESCNSCFSSPPPQACCPSLRIPDSPQEASDRNSPPPTRTVSDQPAKDSHNSQSDGWSSEEDDCAFESNEAFVSSPLTGPPITSEEELASLALISPAKTSQYSGSRVKRLIQVLRHQLEQQELVKEFMALEHLKPSDNCLVGKAPENRDKNRYRDILPYDLTRVPLGENQDYINASYIHMDVGSETFSYICCQGPLPATVSAFWQMVWENKSDVIAMMTQEVEKGKTKCHRYWPERTSIPLDVGRYQLTLENWQDQDYFHIKIIRMMDKESGASHLVRHLKFMRWPDHGVPECSEQLVRFIRYMRAVHHKGPVTVHCSAGIGRTGVLICTDIILCLIENDLPINMSETVKQMRLQRYGMIQTKEQYLFCYKVWLEVLQGILQLHGNQWQPDSPHDHLNV